MTISDNSHLATIVAFYISKYNKDGLLALGYANFSEAFRDVAHKFGVKPSSVKNKRDEFDPRHTNNRVGWHQRPMRPSRAKVVSLFDEVGFEALTDIVKELLEDAEYRRSEEVKEIVESLGRNEPQAQASSFVPRGVTGRKAESLFVDLFAQGVIPIEGVLQDRREDGCGYDFLVRGSNNEYQIEVKGCADNITGILLTDKEWQTARSHPNYRFFIAYHIDKAPKWRIIEPPFHSLQPVRQVRTIVQVSWQVPAKQLGII